MKQTPAHDFYNQSIFSILCDLKSHKVVFSQFSRQSIMSKLDWGNAMGTSVAILEKHYTN